MLTLKSLMVVLLERNNNEDKHINYARVSNS